MCRVLAVSRGGFYAWLARGRSPREQADTALQTLIATSHRQSDGTYATRANPAHPAPPNRLARGFAVGTPNRVWAADLTYCWTQEGWLYLAAVLDLGTRRVVG
jgi:transposase InsO family protein